jgi:hypothetical protein
MAVPSVEQKPIRRNNSCGRRENCRSSSWPGMKLRRVNVKLTNFCNESSAVDHGASRCLNVLVRSSQDSRHACERLEH